MTTDELMGMGIGPAQLRKLTADGVLLRLRRGLYRRARDSDTLPRSEWPLGEYELLHRFRMVAAASGLATGSVFSHVSAAVLHELPVPARLLDRVCTLRPGSGSGTISRRSHRRYARLPAADLTEVTGLPVTSVERTVVDLARTLPFTDAVAVVDAALAAKGVTAEQLLEVLGTGQPQTRKARAALEFGDPGSESPGESRCRATMRMAGVPIPQVQFRVRDERGTEVARADFKWKDLPAIGEYDGMVKYGRLLKPGQEVQDVLMAEKRREEQIRRCGYLIGRWVEADLKNVEEFRRGVLAMLKQAERAA